jgi:putative tryptophan/tyrosine transport system substrate-binding protein
MAPYREFAEAGGLMAYGGMFADMYRRVPVFMDKILKGAKPGELPVERPLRFDFVANLKTAKALGLTNPQSTFFQVTEVDLPPIIWTSGHVRVHLTVTAVRASHA